MGKSKRITLKDIAQAANVTTTTVSYVLNNTPGQSIALETRELVLKVARDLHYVPSSAARALRRQKTGCVGVVAKKNVAVPRFSQTIRGIQSKLEEHDYLILLCPNKDHHDGLSDYVRAYLEGRVDGVIFLGKDNVGPSTQSVHAIKEEHIPFVAYDCQEDSNSYSSVDLDYRGGARLLTERVLAYKPHRMLYVMPQTNTAQEELRRLGVEDALATHPEVELSCTVVPITLDNLETWDLRYSLGSTVEGRELTAQFLRCLKKACEPLESGDAVVASWAGWTEPIRHLSNKTLVTAELAANGESHFCPDCFTRLPNFEAGVACAEELLSLMDGGIPVSRLLHLTTVAGGPGQEPQRELYLG